MKKIIKFLSVSALVAILFFVGSLVADKISLRNDIIRLHVVANSDSEEDQKNKLRVRDAVTAYLQDKCSNFDNATEAKTYLVSALPDLTAVANETLQSIGCTDRVQVSLKRESFGIRKYDTFTLPSGVYESLRIEIGNGEGKNWWCVVFPSLCLPISEDVFVETAVSSGLDRNLADTLKNDDEYEIRFFFLDWLGIVENIFFFS